MAEKKKFVSDLAPGEAIEDLFVLAEARQGQAKNGPFWHLLLFDRSGQVPAKVFSPHSASCPALAAGMVVRVRGQVGLYREELQVVAEAVSVVDQASGELCLADFVAASEREPEDLLAEIEALGREHLTHAPWRKLLKKILADPEIRGRLLAAPGGMSIHHAYVGGLLEHTLAVCRLCLGFCDLYADLDRETLFVAAVLHDLGKAWEYSGGLDRGVTDEGRLLGHIAITLSVLEPFLAKARDLDPELALHLKHLLVSHHGEHEYGSPKRPKTAEAFALHFADNLDARLAGVAEAFEGSPAGQPSWSSFQRHLSRFLYRPLRTPGRSDAPGEDPESEQLCLLPSRA